jgi:hypothetical protein
MLERFINWDLTANVAKFRMEMFF